MRRHEEGERQRAVGGWGGEREKEGMTGAEGQDRAGRGNNSGASEQVPQALHGESAVSPRRRRHPRPRLVQRFTPPPLPRRRSCYLGSPRWPPPLHPCSVHHTYTPRCCSPPLTPSLPPSRPRTLCHSLPLAHSPSRLLPVSAAPLPRLIARSLLLPVGAGGGRQVYPSSQQPRRNIKPPPARPPAASLPTRR